VLCGFIAGVVFTLLTAVLVGVAGREFLFAAGTHAAAGEGTVRTGLALYLATIAAGIWAMWLYAAIRPAFASRSGAVVAASLAWWAIASLQSLKWILLLGIPLRACLPLAANVVPTAIAVFIGALLLGEVRSNLPPQAVAGLE